MNCDKLGKKKNSKRRRKPDHLGVTLTCILLGLGTTPVFGTTIAIALDLDPFYNILEEILPHPYYRDMQMILGCYLLRISILLACSLEYIRFVTLLAYGLLVISSGIISVIHKLQHIKSSWDCAPLYSRLRIIILGSAHALSKGMCLLIPFIHFCTVLALWISTSLWGLVPISILVMSFMFGICLLLASSILLPTLAKVSTETKKLVENRRDRHYITSRVVRHTNLYFFTVWKAQRIVGVPCGTFFTFGPEVTTEYLLWTVDNLMNLTLLINPEAFYGSE